jgi:acyl dehydratase
MKALLTPPAAEIADWGAPPNLVLGIFVAYNSGDNRIVDAIRPAFRPKVTIFLMLLTFEDFQPGHFATLGPRHVTRAEIVAFASEFDPQPMHLDDEAAKQSMTGGLSGSGWHMCALAMRMQVDGVIGRAASVSGLGVDEAKWLAPLRPGDDLMLEVHVDEARPSRSRPDCGIVKIRSEMFNASGAKLMTLVSSGLFRRRASAAAEM